MKNAKYFLLILLAIYSLALGIRIYWLSQKSGYHVDEGLTLAITNYSDYIQVKNYEYNREYTGKELKDMSLIGKPGFKDALNDIKKLWKDNRDPPHTNLYYTFLRLSLVGIKTADMKQIAFRGGLLNLIFFTVSFVFFFLLMRTLFPDSKLLQCGALFCAFLSTATISSTMFFRPYQIQEMLFIIFCFCFIKTADTVKYISDNRKIYITRSVILLSLVLALTLLTGYYAIIFAGLFGLYIIIVKCKEKKYAEIKFYLLVLFLGFLFTIALYQSYFSAFSSYRTAEVPRILFSNIFANLGTSLMTSGKLIIEHFYSIPLLILCLAGIIYLIIRKHKPIAEKHAIFIFTAALLYLIITMIMAPYKILRYGMPVYPFLIILPAILINTIVPKMRSNMRDRISLIAVILLCLCFLPGAFNKNKIENLFSGKTEEYVFAQNKNIPVYIYMHYYANWNYTNIWKYGNLIPYLNDEQTYYFLQNYDDIYSGKYKEFYLVIENFHAFHELNNSGLEILEEVKLTGREPETTDLMGFYFMCRKARLKE